MKIAQYVETFGYVGMFNTMNFASYICLYLISPFMQHPVDSQSRPHFQPGESPSRGLLCDCENFADGSFAALVKARPSALQAGAAVVLGTLVPPDR